MAMTLLSINTDNLIQALCWMLIHSLWQGLLLAFFAAIIVYATRKKSAAIRYNLLTGVLLVFAGAVAFTLFSQLNRIEGNGNPDAFHFGNVIADNGSAFSAGETANSPFNPIPGLISFLNKNANFIVLVWFLLLVMKSIRFIGGLYAIYRIKRSDISTPGEYWLNRLHVLSIQMGIRKKLRFLQSGIAKVPMVIGHLKPLILFPAGVLAALPPAEIEAILMHELAHIRRKDYLVNLCQNFLEIFFFFNPAVLWVSGIIRTERENCCDDIATAGMGSKKDYIQALLSFQEYNLELLSCAPAFPGKRYYLLQRVRRIIYNNNKTLNAMEKTFLTAGLVIMGVSLVAFSTSVPEKLRSAKAPVTNEGYVIPGDLQRRDIPLAKDTVPVNRKKKDHVNGKIVSDVGGKHYEIVLEDNIITKLTIDGKDIPKDKIADFADITDKIIAETIAKAERARAEADRAKVQAERSKEMAEESRVQAELSKEQAALAKKEAEISRELAIEHRKQADHSIELAKNEIIHAEKSREMALEHRKQAEISKEHAKQAIREAEISKQQAQEAMEMAKAAHKISEQSLLEMHKTKKEIVDDLIREKVISNENGLRSLQLSDDSLIVNGVKQSEALHKKYKAKYLKEKGSRFTFEE